MVNSVRFWVCAFGFCAGLAILAGGTASAGAFGAAVHDSATSPLVLKVDRERERKREGILRCCYRKVKGQSLKGLYCGSRILNNAIARQVVRIVDAGGGRKTCTYGPRAFHSLNGL